MRMYDIQEYGSARHFPWLPILALLVACAGAVFWIRSCRAERISETFAGDAPPGETSANATAAARTEPEIYAEIDPPDALTHAQAEPLFAEARTLESQGDYEGARNKLLAILARSGSAVRPRAEEELGRVSLELIVSQRTMTGKVAYKIKPGDSLSRIAAHHNCPVPLIEKANGITNPNRIRPGEVLWIPDKPQFSLEVSKTRNTLTLLLDGKFVKKYRVGTGANARTPIGTFRISEKTFQPTWWPGDGRAEIPFGDPENILGTHWLALEATGDTPPVRGYGIHGTWDDSSIGKQSSAGCVRMKNPDVAEIFMMMPRHSPVTIVEN